ncbi:YIP1 family protein [Labilibacter marinus]|uniref:YIP1 family protein n=1 Tax=Labilibacter marinus TaxID=1477105 RepID=UPI00094F7DB5|nr:YIP1 family protein [Labilibacter marinus]
MSTDILTHIPDLLTKPRKFFAENILGKELGLRDLCLLCLLMFPTLTIFHLIESKTISRLQFGVGIIAYTASFLIGTILSFVFRTYFITALLNKLGYKLDYKKVGMVVGVAMLPVIVMLVVQLLIQSNNYNFLVVYIAKIWSLTIIFIGIHSISKVRISKAIVVVVTLLGFEIMFKCAIAGFGI